MPTLYGVARSRASRALWLIAEAGLAVDRVPVIPSSRLADPLAPDAPLNTAAPAYLAVNPMGQIPALADDGVVLTESLAITLHLARRHGGDLGPRDWREDALMLNWTLFAATAVEPPAAAILTVAMQGRAETEAGRAETEAAAAALARPFARLEAHFGRADWLVGGRFTVADINLAECCRYAQAHGPALAPFPALSSWLARCQARPGYQTMMALRAAEEA